MALSISDCSLAWFIFHGSFAGTGPGSTAAAPPNLKIVKLLWKAQPTGAATALEKAVDQALVRRTVEELKTHLAPLATQFQEVIPLGSQDPRWVAAVAAQMILGDEPAARLVARR